ncbi:MAG: hypothetical protein HYR72_15390 [Deltaproteobacteria bacterium]|nr:hypothetical protein [Deltaproteobacteria bacterium]MBI3390184.1 hypothetical protein [Deltaproteobacteria bacterium]
MSSILSMIVGVLLLLGAATHVYRMWRPFAFIIGSYAVPRWYSLPFAVGEAYAGVLLLRMALA